ncbi:NACHT, LRR and PYD domains-containing protein 3-like isoform X2 [Phaenicophaeus curvirostris]|uniref:NACHT, LRR and PYD domains-containing protein 3-like isoform X2 n=1 Tax=Phaenicophaeus curvirostris TaxID=33595 RepID=UPI0037F09761
MAEQEEALAGLIQALQALTPTDFQEFKTKLLDARVEGGWNIPKDFLAKAAHPCALASCMGNNYSKDAAMDVAIGLFEEMNQRDLAEKLLDEKVKEYERKYREHVVRGFLRYKEVNSRLGENLSISSRYTDLTIATKPWSEHGGEDEAADTSNGPPAITVTAQTLFKPNDDEQTPQTLVLVGAPGMGKTMTVRKVMVEWVEGTLHAEFDYVFCIDCKDVASIKEVSVADLVSKCCPHRQTPVGKILDDQKKILFIFDGFEALGFSLLQSKEELSSDPREVKPLETTLMSLLKRTVLPKSSLLITTRPIGLQSLGRCLKGEHYAEILGFSAAKRKEYFHRYFENNNKADMAFRFARDNEILYSLCTIPIMSWTVCTILEQELCKKKNLYECSKATTRMSVFYLSQLMTCRDGNNPQDLQRFLRKLCSLAANGIWKHKILFEEKEIKDYGLDQPDLLPLFLNEKITRRGVDHGNIYSFTHLHLQEFFAAMFYVLEDDEEADGDSRALTKDINVLLENYSESRKDLNSTLRFLFGLVSQKTIESADKTIGCRISPRARDHLLRWLQGRHGGSSHPSQVMKVSKLDTFHFLFEMNEKGFTQSALGHCTDIDLQDVKLTFYDQMALSFCIREWVGLGCVTLRGCSFHQQNPEEEPATSLPQLQWCRLSESCCAELAALLAEHPSLAHLELGDSTLGDAGVRLLCTGLRQPGCRLRVLRLRYSHLSGACCEDLAAALGTSPCLEELDLSFSEGLRDAGVKLLCEGLQRRRCQLRTLRLGSCRLTGACCQALVESPGLTCLDLSDNELGADGVLQLCRRLRHPACPLRALGLSTSGLSEEALQELAALRMLKPDLKIGDLLEQDVPQAGAMARLPFYRGVLPGGRGPGGRRLLASRRRSPCSNQSRF